MYIKTLPQFSILLVFIYNLINIVNVKRSCCVLMNGLLAFIIKHLIHN